MELRQLRYFVAVAETGNISRAAQRIYLTQPALSLQIKALEEEIGLSLLERQAHSLRLTRAGEALLERARALLAEADALPGHVRAAAQGIRLRVGYAPSFASAMLSEAVERFTGKHPGSRVELADLSTQEMLGGLHDGTLDAVLTATPHSSGRGLHWVSLAQTGWKLALPRSHPLARKKHVRTAELAAVPLLVFDRRDYPEYWALISGWLRQHGHSPAVAGEYDGVNSLLAAVASGLGAAVVTTSTVDLVPRRVCLKDLDPPPATLCITAGCSASRMDEAPLAAFIGELQALARQTEPH